MKRAAPRENHDVVKLPLIRTKPKSKESGRTVVFNILQDDPQDSPAVYVIYTLAWFSSARTRTIPLQFEESPRIGLTGTSFDSSRVLKQ